ncbi:hypothetical protein ACJZ2D_001231 [Fusarium nematophilum]
MLPHSPWHWDATLRLCWPDHQKQAPAVFTSPLHPPTMSFGFGISDAIAIAGLVERVAVEIRNYNDAPRHFQQLQVELDLLASTLRSVLEMQPQDVEEERRIEQIRAIAIHCQRPLMDFCDKMHLKGSGLGHFRTAGTLRTVGTRLHWSLVSAKDVQELRQIILSEMVALNVLLGTHHVTKLRMLKPLPAMGQELERQGKQLSQISDDIKLLKDTPAVLADVRETVLANRSDADIQFTRLNQQFGAIRNSIDSLLAWTRNMTGATVALAAFTAAQLGSILGHIQALLQSLSQCSRRVLRAISRNYAAILEVRREMQKLTQIVESIPAHISLPIVRFDDLDGQSWALPFQACQTWDVFLKLVYKVVYKDPRELGFMSYTAFLSHWRRVLVPGLHLRHAALPWMPNRYGLFHVFEIESIGNRGCQAEDDDDLCRRLCYFEEGARDLKRPRRVPVPRLASQRIKKDFIVIPDCIVIREPE